MRSVNAAVLGSPGTAAALPVASALGKKGSETDVVQFNAKDGDRSLTVLVPARYPERVQGLAFCLASSDVVLLSVEAVDRTLGEQVVAADALAPERGMLLLRNYVTREQVAPLLRNTRLAAWEILEDPPLPDLRERLLDVSSPPRPGPTKVVIDQHFNVKGVGTVALGIVARGEVRRHQDLTVHPTERVAQVRSIQVHDTDVDVAPAGSRVGLALKGVESDELDRGFVLGETGSLSVAAKGQPLRVAARVPPFFKAGLRAGQVVHVGVGWQLVPARVAQPMGAPAGHEGTIEIVPDGSVVHDASDRVALWSLDATGLRLAASGRVA